MCVCYFDCKGEVLTLQGNVIHITFMLQMLFFLIYCLLSHS